MSKYKALLLDLDDTLVNSSQVYNKALRFTSDFLAERYNLDSDIFYQKVLEKHLIVQNNFPTVHTRHSRILVFRMALSDVVKKIDIGILPVVEDMYWDYFLAHIKVFPFVRSTLRQLKKEGILLAVVSDGSLSLRIRKLESVDLLKYMDEVVASEEVIFEKPFSAIFTLALSRLQVGPEEAVMLGNDYKTDIRGAQMVGIKAGLFDPPKEGHIQGQDGTITPDFVIHDFRETKGII